MDELIKKRAAKAHALTSDNLLPLCRELVKVFDGGLPGPKLRELTGVLGGDGQAKQMVLVAAARRLAAEDRLVNPGMAALGPRQRQLLDALPASEGEFVIWVLKWAPDYQSARALERRGLVKIENQEDRHRQGFRCAITTKGMDVRKKGI